MNSDLITAFMSKNQMRKEMKDLQAKVKRLSAVVEAAKEYADWGFDTTDTYGEEHYQDYKLLKDAIAALQEDRDE